MFYFIAKYFNIDTEEDITRTIEFDGQFMANERECYVYAMGKAFDLCRKNECFISIEFLAC